MLKFRQQENVTVNIVMQILQVIFAILLIVAIMFQTTKSESSGGMGGMGWGSIGGKSSSTLGRWGMDEHLNRLTTWIAGAFMVISLLTAILYARFSG
jgi:protein translocase SecG subunit